MRRYNGSSALFALGLWLVLAPAAARADEQQEAVRGLALSELPTRSALAQLEVGTRITSVGGVLGADTALGVGLGRGFVLTASAQVREDGASSTMERDAEVGGSLGYRWGARRISQVRLGAGQGLGGQDDWQVRAGAAVRTTGTSWGAIALDLGMGERLDGTIAGALGTGAGPIVPAVEVKVGRCVEACAQGSVGVRVRLPAAFELGLAVIGEALPEVGVGMALSFAWSSAAPTAE